MKRVNGVSLFVGMIAGFCLVHFLRFLGTHYWWAFFYKA